MFCWGRTRYICWISVSAAMVDGWQLFWIILASAAVVIVGAGFLSLSVAVLETVSGELEIKPAEQMEHGHRRLAVAINSIILWPMVYTVECSSVCNVRIQQKVASTVNGVHVSVCVGLWFCCCSPMIFVFRVHPVGLEPEFCGFCFQVMLFADLLIS